MPLRRAGAVPSAGSVTAPSAPLRKGHSASKTRVNALMALRCVRGTPDVALIPQFRADTVPRASSRDRIVNGPAALPYAPGTLVPGADPDAAAVLGRLW